MCLKDQIIDMKSRGNNEKFNENIRYAEMSNENSSPVFKNSFKLAQLGWTSIKLFSLAAGPTDKSLNSVAVYEHERLNKIKLEQ